MNWWLLSSSQGGEKPALLTGCILGHILVLREGSATAALQKLQDMSSRGAWEQYSKVQYGAEYLELDDFYQPGKLFLPFFYYDLEDVDIQKEEAIAVLEKLIATGETEWNYTLLETPSEWE